MTGIDSADPWGLPPEDDLEPTMPPVAERAAAEEPAEAPVAAGPEAAGAPEPDVVEEPKAEEPAVEEPEEPQAASEAEGSPTPLEEDDEIVAAAALADETAAVAEETVEAEASVPEAGDAELVSTAPESEGEESPAEESPAQEAPTEETPAEEPEAAEETTEVDAVEPEATEPAQGARPMSPLMAAAAGLFGGRKAESTPPADTTAGPTETDSAGGSQPETIQPETIQPEATRDETTEDETVHDEAPVEEPAPSLASVDLEDDELPDELPPWASTTVETDMETATEAPEEPEPSAVEIVEIVEETEEEVVEVIEIEPPEEDLDEIVSQLAKTAAPTVEEATADVPEIAVEDDEEAVLEPAVTDSLAEEAVLASSSESPPSVYGELAELRGTTEAETPGPGEDRASEDATPEGGVVWGARWREAAQGWVEGEDGSSTWRPIVATVDELSDWDVDTYLGIVAGEAPIGDADARATAQRHMVDEAMARGAHAVIGVRFVIGPRTITAYGTAVTLKGSD